MCEVLSLDSITEIKLPLRMDIGYDETRYLRNE